MPKPDILSTRAAWRAYYPYSSSSFSRIHRDVRGFLDLQGVIVTARVPAGQGKEIFTFRSIVTDCLLGGK